MEAALRKVFLLSAFLVFLVSVSLGAYGFIKDGVNLTATIGEIERKVFDMQINLRNVSTGNLVKKISGVSISEQSSTAKRLGSSFEPSTIFGIDHLNRIAASYKGKPIITSQVSKDFSLEISPVGVTVSKDRAILTVSIGNNVQLWLWKKENGKWVTNDVPPGYRVEGADISLNSVAFTLCSISDPAAKRKYEFSFGAVPQQFNSPK